MNPRSEGLGGPNSPSSPEYMIDALLAQRAVEDGNRPYLSIADKTYSFATTNAICRSLARGLRARGLGPRAYLAVMLPNCAEIVFSWYACALIGAANVPINPGLSHLMLETPLRDTKARSLVIHHPLLGQLATIEFALRAQFDWVAVVGDFTKDDLPDGPREYIAFEQLMLADGPDPALRVGPDDVQTVFYTSGTSGPAKGVLTTNALQQSAARGFIRAVGLDRDDVLFTPFPLFHGLAARLGVLPALLVGGHVVVADRFSASSFWKQIAKCGATVSHVMHTVVPILLSQPPSPGDRAHRVRAMFNSRSNPEFEERFNVTLVEAYSMTETGFLFYSPWREGRPGSIGKPHENWEVQLVDELDRPVRPGESGLLTARPRLPNIMMQGYLNRPAETVSAFRNLWFHTGDILGQDDDGYYYYIDRIKDRIRRRGENISSFEIERTVCAHPDIDACAALPHPSAQGEDDIRLMVVPTNAANFDVHVLVAWLSQSLPPSMQPRYIEKIDFLPLTATNKIEKQKLLDMPLGPDTWDRGS